MVNSTGHCSPCAHCFLKTSYPPVFFSVNYFSLIPQGQMVSVFFPYMISHTKFLHLPFQWALLLAGSMSCLCIFYHNCMVWSRHNAWSCCILSGGLDSAKKFLKSRATHEYCPDVIWTVYLSNFFDSAFDIGQTDCAEFSGIILCCSI